MHISLAALHFIHLADIFHEWMGQTSSPVFSLSLSLSLFAALIPFGVGFVVGDTGVCLGWRRTDVGRIGSSIQLSHRGEWKKGP